MGLRFSRRIKILPGLRLNVGKSGVSTSFGTRGAWLTVGKRGTRVTVGLPGTGISYTRSATSAAPSPGEAAAVAPTARRTAPWFYLLLAVVAGYLLIHWLG